MYEPTRYFHVSYTRVDWLTPRIPRYRLPQENDTIPRICFAPTLEQCINAKPDQGRLIYEAMCRRKPFLLYVYSVDIMDYTDADIVFGRKLERYGVDDWEETEELWLLCEPYTLHEEVMEASGYDYDPADPYIVDWLHAKTIEGRDICPDLFYCPFSGEKERRMLCL